jgi:hypothetical protein
LETDTNDAGYSNITASAAVLDWDAAWALRQAGQWASVSV